MRKLKRIAALLFCLCLFASLTVTASADTSYTLTAIGGSHASGYSLTETGTSFSPDISAMVEDINTNYIDDAVLYICKGFHVAGDPTLLVDQTFDHDVNLIAAYALRDSAVQYVIRYVNAATGAEMLPSITGYASVGDVIRVASQYIENYQPQAHNLQLTLGTGANEIVFRYSPAPVATPTPGQQNQNQNQQNQQNQQQNVPGGAGDNAGAGGNAGAGAPGAAEGGLDNLVDDQTPLAAPEDLIDLTDPDVPQALPIPDGAVARSEAILRSGRVAAIAGGVGLVAALAALLFFLRRKRDQKG